MILSGIAPRARELGDVVGRTRTATAFLMFELLHHAITTTSGATPTG